MADLFNNISGFPEMEQTFFIWQNARGLTEYINENQTAIGNSPEKALIAMQIMATLYDGKNFTPNFKLIAVFLRGIVTETTYPTIKFTSNQFLKNIFSTICAANAYSKGLEYFASFKDTVHPSMFSAFKAYLMYFSYHTKDYSEITDMLSSIISFADIEELIDNVEHAMYYYYKALIHLRLNEFEKAYISFSVCIQSFVLQKGLLITTLQLEAIKHIIIMSYIPSLEKYRGLNDFLFIKMDRLKNVTELAPFSDLYRTKGANFAMWIENNKLVLKQAKLVGLTKVAYKEFQKANIVNVLKKYKRIHVKTLMALSDLSEESLLINLRTLVQKDEVNIQYDEAEGIIEVLPVDYCNENMFDKLKGNYECLTNENNDLINAIKLIKEVYLKKEFKPRKMEREAPAYLPSKNPYA